MSLFFSVFMHLIFRILARSPVFKAMFQSKMLESTENIVEIEDFDDETVKGMLEYIYTGGTESLQENAPELLKIGDKYQLLGLKEDCERAMKRNLSVDNAMEVLILAHTYNSTKLKTQVIKFIRGYKSFFILQYI